MSYLGFDGKMYEVSKEEELAELYRSIYAPHKQKAQEIAKNFANTDSTEPKLTKDAIFNSPSTKRLSKHLRGY